MLVALGGNALQKAGGSGAWTESVQQMRLTAPVLARLAHGENELVVTHGNGPQVGALLRSTELAAREIPPRPLDVLDAESEGQLGYLIAQELSKALHVEGVDRAVLSLLARMEVDPRDPAFRRPTKPIGGFYTEEEARRLRKGEGWTVEPDRARGGWRRVVPSPRPRRWVEGEAVRALFDAGLGRRVVLVTGGGGGIPVVRRAGGVLEGTEAVIDKDLAAALIARTLGVDTFIILTDVAGIAVGFGTRWERWLGAIGQGELDHFYRAGEFPAGSMGPKVEAGLEFLQGGGEEFIVTDIPSFERALLGEAGTRVRREPSRPGG
jgi:carbamate kinase